MAKVRNYYFSDHVRSAMIETDKKLKLTVKLGGSRMCLPLQQPELKQVILTEVSEWVVLQIRV